MSNHEIYLPAEPLLECPACGLPAEIADRFTLNGAPAPVEHVKLVCMMRHWFTIPADQIPVAPPAATAPASRPAEAGAGRNRG